MELVKDTPFEFAFFVSQMRPPRSSATVLLKATFDLTPGVCAIAAEQLPCGPEVYNDDDETRSEKYDTDFALRKLRGECFVTGTCHVPGGRALGVSGVAFKIGRVSKALAVFGDRHWTGRLVSAPSEPVPFRAMPLAWERSFGGPGYAANLYGTGIAQVDSPEGKRRPLPNIEHPEGLIRSPNDRPPPAGCFPISRMAQSRMARAGTYNERWKKTRWPWLPEDFDWAYFNAAPADQQIDGFWSGDEEIVLRNLRPQLELLKTRLPGLRGKCFFRGAAGTAGRLREVPMVLDTITVDADAGRALCVWRGVTEVESEKLTEVEHVFVLHEPIDTRRPLSEYADMLERKLREAAGEDAAFVPEVPPAGPEPAAASPAGAPALGAAAEAAAKLAAVGMDLAASGAPAPPAAPPRPAMDAPPALPAMGAPPPLPAMGVPPPSVAVAAPPPPIVASAPAVSAPADVVDAEAAAAQSAAAAAAEEADRRAELRPQVRDRITRGESLAGMDLTGADLSRLDLSRQDLSAAILQGADLTRTVFDGGNLDGAVLAGATLSGASMRQASLRKADLAGVTARAANFESAVLDDAVLAAGIFEGSVFESASCKSADLSRADLSRTNFRAARLDEAELSGARLDGATFARAVLTDATLEDVSAVKVIMDDADLTQLRASEGSRFGGGSFKRVKAAGSRWVRAQLDRADFSLSDLTAADFTGASLEHAKFDGCSLRKARFLEARMNGVTMVKSDGMEGSFESADLSGADLRAANLFGAEFWRARTGGVRLELANVRRTKLE